MNVPAKLPDGGPLYWCVFIDSDEEIAEGSESNSIQCVRVGGGAETVARDDLSKLFGSAVRNRQEQGLQVDP